MRSVKSLALVAATMGCLHGSNSVESVSLEDALFRENVPIVFSPKVTNNLIFVYSGLRREFPLCAEGYRQGGVYGVMDVSIPVILGSDSVSSRFLPGSCGSPFYVGMIHNHPVGNCVVSVVDYDRFRRDKRALLEIIVCDASIKGDSLVVYNLVKGGVKD